LALPIKSQKPFWECGLQSRALCEGGLCPTAFKATSFGGGGLLFILLKMNLKSQN
jgi:hypothetical protein